MSNYYNVSQNKTGVCWDDQHGLSSKLQYILVKFLFKNETVPKGSKLIHYGMSIRWINK